MATVDSFSPQSAFDAGYAAGVAAGRKQAAVEIREHAEATGWYEGGGVWADAIEIAEGAERAAKRAEGGEPNAG